MILNVLHSLVQHKKKRRDVLWNMDFLFTIFSGILSEGEMRFQTSAHSDRVLYIFNLNFIYSIRRSNIYLKYCKIVTNLICNDLRRDILYKSCVNNVLISFIIKIVIVTHVAFVGYPKYYVLISKPLTRFITTIVLRYQSCLARLETSKTGPSSHKLLVRYIFPTFSAIIMNRGQH